MKVQKGIEFVTVAIFLLVLILLSFLLTTSRHHGRTNSHKEDSLREESSEQHKHYICNHKPSKLTLTEDETMPGTICGRVVRFSDNSPCRGAQVKIKRVRQPQPAFPQSESTKGWDAVTRTGAEGEFSFKNVSPGCLVILADYKGLPTLTLDNVWLPPAGKIENLVIALSDSLTLKGTVISKESGLPVEGAIVTVTRVFPPEPPRTTLTDSSGQFTFSELQRAEYSVKAAAKGYVQEPQVPDSCRLDNTLTYITIFMQTSGRITGVVKDFSGLPVADAKVSFGRWTTTTREDGTYAMDVQPGTADLIVTHNDFSLESVDLVEVREGDWRVVNVTLRQGCLLHGRVTDSFGKPVVGASVRITGYWRNFNASYIYPNTSTDENGEYRFPHAAEGTYIIELQSQGYEVIYKTIEIPKGLKEHKEDFSLLKGARISGSVFDSSGRGVPDVNVRVKGGPSVTGAIAMTRNDGSFVVEGVSPARITLFVLRKKATPLYLLKM